MTMSVAESKICSINDSHMPEGKENIIKQSEIS